MYELYENPVFISEFIANLARTVKGVKHDLKMYSGEAHDAVFDNSEFIEAIRYCHKKKISIQVVVGPVVMKGDNLNSPQILDLAKNGIIKLYFRPTRGTHSHFRIIDDKLLEIQPSHAPLLPLHHREEHRRAFSKNSSEEFKSALNEFFLYAKPENLYNSDTKKFLVVDSSDLSRVVDYTNSLKRDYSELTLDEIKKYLDIVRQRDNEFEQEALDEVWEDLNHNWGNLKTSR